MASALKVTINNVRDAFTTSAPTPSGQKTPADDALTFFGSISSGSEAPVHVYELKLEDDGGPNKEKAYTRLPPPYTPYVLRVTINAGVPASKNGVFKTNFPLDGGIFDRNTILERPLPTDLSKPIKIDLPISHPGAFKYWIEYDDPTSTSLPPTRITGREGYFNIDPILRVKARTPILSPEATRLPQGGQLGSDLVNLPLDGLAMLTVVSKWMGPISEWAPYLAEAKSRGYNMLHFTPLQLRGESRSPYSIADQLAYDPELFGPEWKGTKEEGVKHLEEQIATLREQYGLLSLTDVVLNHTANNSPWLLEHPEAGFSPFNAPHLTPAFEIDTAILDFSSSLATKGLPTRVTSSGDIDALMNALTVIFNGLNLWQYYVLDVTKEKANIKARLTSTTPVERWTGSAVAGKSVVELAELVRSSGKLDGLSTVASRYVVKVESGWAASLVRAAFTELSDNADALAEAWGRVVDVLNVPLYEEANGDLKAALEQIRGRVQYTRLDAHGPKLGEITAKLPLVEPYFTRLPLNETTSKHDPKALALANNGWIWNANPMQNFAELPSKAYLRREVIVWGDCVKLRYGSGPEDNPWLWSYMREYVCYLAKAFDGFRLDNSHSTPLHVGMEMLDAARRVNPNLYVCAELFTGSEEMDLHFVSRLGVNSLIREAMNGHDPKDFSGLLYRYGLGKPIGSMDGATLTSIEDLPSPVGKGSTRTGVIFPLNGSVPHALMYDITHDNESALDKRSAEDALSTGALVTFSYSAIGSNKGFDDLFPKLLDLVSDNRRYEVGDETGNGGKGIGSVKRVLNHLHTQMSLEGYSEGHVHQENDYIMMHRVQPATQKGYLLVAHTAFGHSKGNKDRGWLKPVQLRRTKAKFITGATIDIPSYDIPHDDATIHGLRSTLTEISDHPATEGTDADGPFSEIHVPEYFPPGSIMLYATNMEGLDPSLEAFCANGADEAFNDLDLVDLNVLLHRADGEERDATDGKIGTFNIPGYGNLVYCGLEGWMGPLRNIARNNDLGHPLCAQLREGTWAFDYIVDRLTSQTDVFPRLSKAAAWFKERFNPIKSSVPSFLRPKYFTITVMAAYKAARRTVVEQLPDFVSSGTDFTQSLALCAVQMYGLVKSASISPDPAHPVASLAAGLPHFTAGWARCWGRDVFISLRGLFLTTGNFAAAREHILAFSSTLKHGLIPNLLDSVRNPRYNSRDSPWWMLQNIQDYASFAPEGLAILDASVKRRFPKDDTFVPWDSPLAYAYSSTVAEIIQEVLQRHADGISFREHNAGPNLDSQMRDEGFNIEVHVDWKTGIIFGGNEWNCGTWQDKMGESEKAGTKGVPGTPRDGAPVEITGLLKSTLRWVAQLSKAGKFPFKGVEATIDGKRRLVTYSEWDDLLQASFEKCYYVPTNPSEDTEYNIKPNLVNRRGIYKDVYGSGAGREWSDYQLRSNYPIAMTVAPELFDPRHALIALQMADQVLRGPLGMKTLDPTDSQYRGIYDNSNDSSDPAIAKGRNYHQGPEWGWPLGFFLRAYFHFDTQVGRGKENPQETLHYLATLLLPARHHISTDVWAGIPELTNENGAYCHDSCNTQAWSASTLLDFLQEVYALKRK